MKIDYHLHGSFSADSNADYELMVIKAINRKYKEIAFTDHFDLIIPEIRRYGVPPYYEYVEKIAALKEKYQHLSILTGVEIGDYHRCHQFVDELFADIPPEIKIASVHALKNGDNISIPIKGNITQEQITDYYEQNLALVEYGNFDILGHLGVHKRYFINQPDESEQLPIIKNILSTIIAKDIALEVNLSGLSKPARDLIPSTNYLKMYQEMGGNLITIGSDAHTVEEFDNLIAVGIKKLREIGFKSYFKKEKNGWEALSLL